MTPRFAGTVVAHRSKGEWRLLVLRRAKTWDFVTGNSAADADELEIAKTITQHSTGIEDLQFDFGESFKETIAYGHGTVTRYFLATTHTSTVDLAIVHPEGSLTHDEWRWVTCDEAEDVLPPRLTHILEWARDKLESSETRH
jgi:hypothetical protein